MSPRRAVADDRRPTLDEERRLQRAGHVYIAGLDEAGRGAWGGPVVAAAVILPLDDPTLAETLRGVRDSKLCTYNQREALYPRICQVAIAWATASIPASRIDEIGIIPSTRQAMRECVAQLAPGPNALLIDAVQLPTLRLPQRAISKGDLKSLAIAAASILAKVTRDREMSALEETYPSYGFSQHKGYGTRAHRQALWRLGPVPIHRWSFSPVAAAARRAGNGRSPGIERPGPEEQTP